MFASIFQALLKCMGHPFGESLNVTSYGSEYETINGTKTLREQNALKLYGKIKFDLIFCYETII